MTEFLDRKLIADCQQAAGREIHEVASNLSGYINQFGNVAFYDKEQCFSEEANEVRASLQYHERVLRSFLVTKDIHESRRLVAEAMENGK